MAAFKYDDAVKYKFKYLYEVINNIESSKKISVAVKKNLYQEQLLEPTKKNAKLKTLKTKLKTTQGPQIIQFLKDNDDVFKTTKGEFFAWTKINKVPYSKSGGSRGGAEVTALAESMQCYFNSYYWDKGITASEPTEVQLRAQEKYCFTDRTLTKCLAADEIKSWRNDNVFDKIAIELKHRFDVIFTSRPTFHRGSEFMKRIYKAKATVHKNDKKAASDNSPPTLPQAPGSFGDDKWNPGDIWMTTLSSGSDPLKDHVCTWGSLNDEVVHLANTGKLMGVSLKRVDAAKAHITFFNKKRKKEQQKFIGFSFGKQGEFFSSIDCYLHGSTCMIQCRCMDVFKSWQGEISAVSAAGGKIGGGNIDFFLNDVFRKKMFGTNSEPETITAASQTIQMGLNLKNLETNAFLKEFYNLYKRFAPLSSGSNKDKNPTTKDEFLELLNNPPPGTKYTTKGFLVSKYLCMKMLEVVFDPSSTGTKRDRLMTLFCLYAMSNSNQSSFFIKIS